MIESAPQIMPATRARTLAAALAPPFAVILTLYVVTLPMAYGVLQRSVSYPLIAFFGSPDAVPDGDALFLLDRKADGFVVWNRNRRLVLWIPTVGLKRAEIRAVKPLFEKATK